MANDTLRLERLSEHDVQVNDGGNQAGPGRAGPTQQINVNADVT